MPSPSAVQDLDEKSLMSFVDNAVDLDSSSSERGDEGGGSSGPPSSILQAPSSPSSPPSSRQQPPASIRSSNYKSISHSSSSLTTAASASSASMTSASASTSSRKLPDIALDLSGSPGLPSSGSNGGHFGTNSVLLPSPQHHVEAKKKPFLMASLATDLNEIFATNDDEEHDLGHNDHHDYSDDHSTVENDRGTMQAKHASFSSSPGSNGRSPKKFQLGLPQKSPSYALASPKGNASPTGSNDSKLLPISLGGGGVSSSGGGGGGNLSPHSLLKFDPIMGGSSKCVDLEGSGGTKSRTTTDHPSPSSYRKTIASRSPLRDRSILGNASDIEFTIAPAKSTTTSFLGSSSGSSSPSKLDPLDTESIRGSTFASSGASLLLPERKAPMKLPSSSMSDSSSPEKAQPQSQDAKLTTSSNLPGKQLAATTAAAAQPKFCNPFKKNPAANGDKSAKSTATQDDDIDLLGGSRHSPIAQASVAALAPMDEFNYLSFSPRAGGGGKQSARDLPSLPLSSEEKNTGGSSNSKSPAKKTKKAKDKTQQQDQEVK